MNCPNCNAPTLYTKDGQCPKCEHLPKNNQPKKRSLYHRAYQKRIMADPVRKAKYLAMQTKCRIARKTANEKEAVA